MSACYVAQWTVSPAELDAHDSALRRLAAHTRTRHPAIIDLRILRQRWGPLARHGYMWIEEYESLEELELDSRPPACTCDEEWAPLYTIAVAGTFHGAVWSDRIRDQWFSRPGADPVGEPR